MAHRDQIDSSPNKASLRKGAKRQKLASPSPIAPSKAKPSQRPSHPGAHSAAPAVTAGVAHAAENQQAEPIDVTLDSPSPCAPSEEQLEDRPSPGAVDQAPVSPPPPPPPPLAPDDEPSTSGWGSGPPQPSRARQGLPAPFRSLSARSFSRQTHDLFLVLDLEATCTKRRDLFPIEIIEVAAVLVDGHSLAELGHFHSYVRPTEHPLLDPFCVELTGIEQEQVDTAPLLAEVLPRLQSWLEGLGGVREGASLLPVTWTDWDLKVCLEQECEWRKLPRPPFLRRWCNLKQLYTAKYRRTNNLRKCVEAVGLTWQGRQHSGLDDTRNTVALAARMVRDGCVLKVTDCFKDPPPAPTQQTPTPEQRQPGSQSQPQSQSQSRGGGGGVLRQTVLTLTAAAAPPAAADATEAAAAASPGAAAAGGGGGEAAAAGASVVVVGAAAAELPLYDSSGRWLGRCRCGVAAHFRTTKKPGANLGRQFYSCGRWTISDRSRQCDFFAWADQLALAPAAGAGGGAGGGAGAASQPGRPPGTGTKRRR